AALDRERSLPASYDWIESTPDRLRPILAVKLSPVMSRSSPSDCRDGFRHPEAVCWEKSSAGT
ncbi:MAG TPA: hypothetical protein VGH13_09035, partial [Xanthobacteraceae bacterium]